MVNVKYRIINFDQKENQLIVRYFTDKLSERDLSSLPPDEEISDIPNRCRTDTVFTIYPNMINSAADLDTFLISRAPRGALELLESPTMAVDPNIILPHVNVVKSEETSANSFTLKKNKALNDLKASFYWQTPTIAYKDTLFQGNASSQFALSQTLIAGSVPLDFTWIDLGNTNVPMTFVELQVLYGLMQSVSEKNFKVYQNKKKELQTATTEGQLTTSNFSWIERG